MSVGNRTLSPPLCSYISTGSITNDLFAVAKLHVYLFKYVLIRNLLIRAKCIMTFCNYSLFVYKVYSAFSKVYSNFHPFGVGK